MLNTLLKWIVLLTAIGGGGWLAYSKYWSGKNEIPEYSTEPVNRADMRYVVTASGELKSTVLVQVGSEISGRITKLYVDFNSPVKQGDRVAEIDPATYQANLLQAEGELANAKAELELAKLNAERKKQLRAKDLAPMADLDKAMADLAQAEARLQIREASLQKAQADRQRCTIFSPIDGIVISRKVDVGQTVAASLNAPVLFEIAEDLTRMEIHANVAEADIGGIKEGQDVEFEVEAFRGTTFRGRVKQVRNAPTTVENVVTYVTVIDVENPDLKLKPGMTADVSIILAERKNALTVPNAALRFRPDVARQEENGGPGGPPGGPGGRGSRGRERRDHDRKPDEPAKRTVYKLGPKGPDGAPRLIPVTVEIGIEEDIRTEILGGLEENDEVVTRRIVKTSSFTAPAAASPFGGGPPRR